MDSFTTIEVPKYAGAYWLGGVGLGFAIHIPKRPRWLSRWAMRAVFGWEWQDFDQ
jgi:hypothetical protein